MLKSLAPSLLCGILAAPALAQESSATNDGEDIVVTGQRDQKEVVHDYIKAVVAEAPGGQYARFDGAICPSVFGFAPDTSRFIETRMRAVAEAGGIATGAEGCNANLHVVVIDDDGTMLTELREKHRSAFGGMPPHMRDRVLRGEGPIYNWHLVKERAHDNGRSRSDVGSSETSDIGRNGGTYGFLSTDGLNTGRSHVKSLIASPVRQSMEHSFVLIERRAVIGLSPVQIADYAIMRGLIMTDEEAQTNVIADSILGLFDADYAFPEKPEALTLWDLALLKSLYAAPGNMTSRTQRSDMSATFRKVLAEGQ